MKSKRDKRYSITTLLKTSLFIVVFLVFFKNMGGDATPKMVHYSKTKLTAQHFGSF